MATIVRYVDPDAAGGGDGTTNALSEANCAYVSLNVWEAARQADIDAANNIEQAVCCSNGGSHTADTTAVVIDGWTTSATDYIDIMMEANHLGVWNDSNYRLQNAGTLLTDSEDYVRIKYLQFNSTGDYGIGILINNGANGDNRVRYCIVKSTASNGDIIHGIRIQNGSSLTNAIYNNIIYDFKNTGTGTGNCFGILGTSGQAQAYNNTVQGCKYGIYDDWRIITAKNNLVCDSTTANYSEGNFRLDSNYNWSDDATDTDGANDINSGTAGWDDVYFVDLGGDNFHLAASGGADKGPWGNGVDLSAIFIDDIDGDTRIAWDIGADEYVAAGGGRTTKNSRSNPLGSKNGMALRMD